MTINAHIIAWFENPFHSVWGCSWNMG